jgi:hypothetical protein
MGVPDWLFGPAGGAEASQLSSYVLVLAMDDRLARAPHVQPGNSWSRAERSGSSMPRVKRLRWSTTHTPSRPPSGVM